MKDNECWFVKFFANGFTKTGVPDILACVNGYFVGIEVKAPNGKLSELQKYNARQINESCGIAIILYPKHYDLFVAMVKCLLDGDEMSAWRIAHTINSQWDK